MKRYSNLILTQTTGPATPVLSLPSLTSSDFPGFQVYPSIWEPFIGDANISVWGLLLPKLVLNPWVMSPSPYLMNSKIRASILMHVGYTHKERQLGVLKRTVDCFVHSSKTEFLPLSWIPHTIHRNNGRKEKLFPKRFCFQVLKFCGWLLYHNIILIRSILMVRPGEAKDNNKLHRVHFPDSIKL